MERIWKITRDETGVIEYTCSICGAIYDNRSEWNLANLEWHEH